MKIMVIGSGGREHAIIKKLKENPAVTEIYALPGNGGIALDAVCVDIGAKDIARQVDFAKEKAIDFAVVAPDDPLVLGAVDALEALGMAGLTRRAIPVVTMQTIAANLGSMATPIGNPQNLYLYSRYHLGAGTFFTVTLPYVTLSALLLALFVILQKPRPIQAPSFSGGLSYGKARFGVQAALFALCLCAVARVLNVWIAVAAVLVGMLLADRRALLRVDYALLFTFAGFFVVIGNLGRMEAFSDFLRGVLAGREVPVSIAASQVLSNVPAALLLSGFTEDAVSLVIGTNLGGLGTLIASMASLISYKQIAQACPEQKRAYFLRFTAVNVLLLALLLLFALALGAL